MNEKLQRMTSLLTQSTPRFVALASALSMVGGAAIGYAAAMKKLQAQFADLADREIAEAKEHYRQLYKVDEYATPEDAVATLMDENPTALDLGRAVAALKDYQGRSREVMTEFEPPIDIPERSDLKEIGRNVFTDAKVVELNLEEEQRNRDPELPYLITQDEFGQNETEHEQVTVTFYEGDGILADDKDEPIDNVDETVGSKNLVRFGEGSGDPNIVFVRNVKLVTDFEIIRSRGKFSVEVAGFPDEDADSLTHSHQPMRRTRFRDDDD